MKLPVPLRLVNETVAFLLELAALALLGWWGWHVAPGPVAGVLLAVLLPGAAAVLWGMFAAPKARIALPVAGVLAVKAVVFGAAAAAYYAVGAASCATAFAVMVVVNTALATLDRRARGAS
ncbi:YrdB family protein [Kitasatospora sp. NPDC001664]|uniref:YrdB family protein n=1 Tax=Kitasatospora albolonga TaxID=68173 RepID=UPI0035EDBD37